MNIEGFCAAPRETLAHSPSKIPLSCPVALGVDEAEGHRAFAHADTRAEHLAGLQIVRFRALDRQRAPKIT